MAPKNLHIGSLVPLILLTMQIVTCSSNSESEVLLKFKQPLKSNKNGGLFTNWVSSTPPCSGNKENWVGVLCQNDSVWGLKLENMGLSGVIEVESLNNLSSLRTISLMNNNFDGTLPSLKKLGELKSVYFSNNKFSGNIDANAFDGMHSLKKIHLENNEFTGSIPLSFTTLPKLVELSIAGNKFEGEIPIFKLGILKSLNVSNNRLQGQIPANFGQMNASSFSGNENLCGPPLKQCPPPSPSKFPIITIVVIMVSVVAALAVIAAVIIILCRHRHQMPQTTTSQPPLHGHKRVASDDLYKAEQGGSSPTPSTNSKKGENCGKLLFLSDDVEKFDLPDLLKASAEVLGSGYLGSSYKAALMTGKMMVVKRFRHMNNVGKEEFQEHMRRLGRLSHTNLLPIVAFYYRREEKLLVSEYVDNVSLAVHLHGNRSRGHPSPDWPTRLKIIKGVARGLFYLYNELPSLIVPHGHLKSSNILVNESFQPLLTDYGLVPVVNQEHAQEVLVVYKSPEYKQNNRVTKKTDVWSFGILILEILTGKFPANILQHGKGTDTDLMIWVQSIVREDQCNWEEVFDKDMGVVTNCEGEMVKLLKIGMCCAESDVEKRWDMKEAIEKIEEVKENIMMESSSHP